jgi:exosome complex component CSL4
MGKDKTIVVPGDFLGVSEEFTLGNGVYDEKGNIYALLTGEVSISEKRVINIQSKLKIPSMPKEGDIVIGRIEDLRDTVAIVSIACIKGKENRGVFVSNHGIIHISNIKSGFVTELQHEFGYLDIVRAKVIDVKTLRLSTEREDLGVIKAICSRCKGDLRRNGNVLVCENCKRAEIRKISTDYGKGIV